MSEEDSNIGQDFGRKSITWNRENLFQLISAVEEHQVIWNVKSVEYKNRDARELAWDSIAKEINVTKQEANDKWRLLRQQFRNALKKVNASKSGMAAMKKPPNEYFNSMMFLQPVMSMQSEYRESNMKTAPPPPASNLEIVSDGTNMTDYEESSRIESNVSLPEASLPEASTSKASKRSRKNDSDELYTAAVTKAMDIINEKEVSPNLIWARYIASVMDNHAGNNAVRQFKFRVNRLVEQLEMGELNCSPLPMQIIHTQTIQPSQESFSQSDSQDSRYTFS